MTQAVATQPSAETQRLETVKAHLHRQRDVVSKLAAQVRSNELSLKQYDDMYDRAAQAVKAAEGALSEAQAKQQRLQEDLQASQLVQGQPDTAIAARLTAVTADVDGAQQALENAQTTLQTRFLPVSPLGKKRAELAERQAQLQAQHKDALTMLQALERHARDAHLAAGHAAIDAFAGEYDATIQRLQEAYQEAQAAREQLAALQTRIDAAFGSVGGVKGSWHASAADGASAGEATQALREELARRAPMEVGRTADVVSAYDALVSALVEGAGRMSAQIGAHALRATMPLDEPYFAGAWPHALKNIYSPRGHAVFTQLRQRVGGLFAEVWLQARPATAPEPPKAS